MLLLYLYVSRFLKRLKYYEVLMVGKYSCVLNITLVSLFNL